MFTVLFLNDDRGGARSYNAFISAYCLARLGYRVIYACNKRQLFINEFYEGPTYGFREIFDDEVSKQAAVLPPSLYTTIMNYRNTDAIRDMVDEYGGAPDIIMFSGNDSIAGMACQMARAWGCTLIHADILDLPPCVNEIQLQRVNKLDLQPCRRLVSITDTITDSLCRAVIEIGTGLNNPEIYMIGHYIGTGEEQYLRQYDGLRFIPNRSDNGRLRAIAESGVFIHLPMTPHHRSIAEALVIGTPVVAMQNSLLGIMQRLYPEQVLYCRDKHDYNRQVGGLLDDATYRNECGAAGVVYARQHFGFANRMLHLQQQINQVI